MGDRGNIKLVQRSRRDEEPQAIYLYTHWGGSDLPVTLRQALERGRDRWGDDAYLARIIFCEMVRDRWADTSGFGISIYTPDNEHPVLEVDADEKRIRLLSWSGYNAGLGSAYAEWSFEEYLAADPGDLHEAFEKAGPS